MILSALYFLSLVSALLVALPVAIFMFETFAAIVLPGRGFTPDSGGQSRARVGVLIPAHNEEAGLSGTIAKIRPQLRPGDRLLVVADNCSDETAPIARTLGAEVVIRTDPVNRGKGFALDCGIRHFAGDPPEIVVVIDADCVLGDFAIDRFAAACKATNRPVQGLDLMIAAPGSAVGVRFREFAWRVKNWLRPLGLSAAGLPCQLMGTGMAIPWQIISTANLATGSLVEDLKLGLELAAGGHPPVFCPAAMVTSEFPTTDEGSRSQQRRWEVGHLGVIATEVPRFLMKGVRRGDGNLVALTLDAAVPPLTLLWLMILTVLVVGFGFWQLGIGSAAFVVSLWNTAGFLCAAAACWLAVGRDILSLRSGLSVGLAALAKAPFYWRIVFRRQADAWIRTDRRKL